MFSKINSLTRINRIPKNTSLRTRMVTNQCSNDCEQTINRNKSERLSEKYDALLYAQRFYMDSFNEFVSIVSDDIILETHLRLKKEAEKIHSEFESKISSLEAKVIQTENNLNNMTKNLKNMKNIVYCLSVLFIGVAAVIFKKAGHLNNTVENTKKDLHSDMESLKKDTEKTWNKGYLTALRKELESREIFLKKYNDEIDKYWPRPWPSYRTMYRERIKVLEMDKNEIKERIKEMENEEGIPLMIGKPGLIHEHANQKSQKQVKKI